MNSRERADLDRYLTRSDEHLLEDDMSFPQKDSDRPAFAQSVTVGPAGDLVTGMDFIDGRGMTFREYTAIAMMQAVLSSPHSLLSHEDKVHGRRADAHAAVRYADDLLAELKRTESTDG